jgi:hypothetical protein
MNYVFSIEKSKKTGKLQITVRNRKTGSRVTAYFSQKKLEQFLNRYSK